MTYREFLLRCRQIAKIESKSEFARKLGVQPNWYLKLEAGDQLPGRPLLEKAAELADLKFEDCISIPVEPSTGEQQALNEFKRALEADDDRRVIAETTARNLETMRKSRDKKKR